MIENRPMQNLYFNVFAGQNLKDRWDFDYWGLGNRNALKFILENTEEEKVKIKTLSFTPLEESIKMLDPKERRRFIFVDNMGEADFLVDNYRMTNKNFEKTLSDFQIYKQFKSGGEIFLTIYSKK
jgi:hypothetical protein